MNLQATYERGTATSIQRPSRQLDLEYQDWARLQARGRGLHTAGGHGRNRHVGCQWQGQYETELRGPATRRNLSEMPVLVL